MFACLDWMSFPSQAHQAWRAAGGGTGAPPVAHGGLHHPQGSLCWPLRIRQTPEGLRLQRDGVELRLLGRVAVLVGFLSGAPWDLLGLGTRKEVQRSCRGKVLVRAASWLQPEVLRVWGQWGRGSFLLILARLQSRGHRSEVLLCMIRAGLIVISPTSSPLFTAWRGKPG